MTSVRNHSGSNSTNNKTHNESPLQAQQQQQNDAALKNAIRYVREFNSQAASYHLLKSEESLVHLHRTIALLGSKIQPHCFVPSQLELAKFFVDLHALMGALDGDSEALWACVGLLQHCSRNLEARRAIVDQFCYVPLLSYLLKRTSRPERVQRLLLLLQDLTYGIRISWEEPYLVVLLEHLVEIVHSAEGDASEEPAPPQDDKSHALLALSILVNLCYKNFAALFLLLRSINISQFSRRIQHFGLLAYKMLIILSEDVHAFEQHELHTFLRTAFAAMIDCLQLWNVPQLRHIVDFLLDANSHAGLHRAMLSYEHYCEDIERLLDQIDARGSMDDSGEESRKHQQFCMDLVFQLISYVLQLSSASNIISLDSITPRLYELLCQWLDSELCGVAAIELLAMLLQVDKRVAIAQLMARERDTVERLVASAERVETRPAHVAAILRLLLILLREPKTEKLVLAKVSASYFDKILALPLAIKPGLLSKQAIGQAEVEQTVCCLQLLINFADIAKKAYFEKCCALLELPQLQYALARAMLGGSDSLAAVVFQIAQFEHFPRAAVAKYVASIGGQSSGATVSSTSSHSHEQCHNLNAILKSHRSFIDKELAQRVNALVDRITSTLDNHELQHAPVTQVIELYNHRIGSLNCAVQNMQQRLEQASSQVASTTQLSNVQNAQLEQFQSKNFELLISQERLQAQCKDLKQQKDKLKCTMTNMLKQLSENSELLQTNERRLAAKTAEIQVLQKNCEELNNVQSAQLEEFQTQNSELLISQERLQAQCKDLKQQKDKLKSSMASVTKQLSDNTELLQTSERRLATKTAEFAALQKDAEELRASFNVKSEDLSKLEALNKDNTTRIEKLKKSVGAYEQDIKEKLRTIEERERELAKTHKLFEEQLAARKKSEDLVCVLEIQLKERKDQIESLENEQKETEDLRATIMSLMESKKPKRKA